MKKKIWALEHKKLAGGVGGELFMSVTMVSLYHTIPIFPAPANEAVGNKGLWREGGGGEGGAQLNSSPPTKGGSANQLLFHK